ncbi:MULTISPECIES: GNAT family N-acetyltransferase [unclassified Polaribacter]|uniref:GNAT family N-acetyltransferase n=1 Tax=unclassified Polaribacter TaxID=196858 RepID=UPI0011BDE693|nr:MULTISPECIES: GNAT family N-acetyltransferase [unclassified Polaribacter]TXD51113.1 GNAT family N-acetyltransferase [Polaribacter sp. IC063]TXD58175.1 GNAT family N-acetyltransferase [Polaribacter sp. IC066]
MILLANTSDAKMLTQITLKSKAIWGYSDEQLKNWTEELTVSEKMIQEMIVYKFTSSNQPVGFYILNQPKEASIELEFLFVLPNFMGKGIGHQLITHAFSKAIALHCNQIHLVADLNAVPFYQSKGFTIITKKKSVIFDRILPVLQKDLTT